MLTELRTYIGQPGTLAYDGYAGFTIGERYDLSYLRRGDGTVAVMSPLALYEKLLLVSEAQFNRWWVA